jgi:pescadillo protein
VLRKLRDHKAFAKKIARALGRGEWSSAKSLDENKPSYSLDHIVKERCATQCTNGHPLPFTYGQFYNRYPTFIDALRDIDDALCLVSLFASLPSSPRIAPTIIDSCSRLASEWQLYVMHTRSLRKVFLSIKGVYFQAEVGGETITWLVPYLFTQAVRTATHNYPLFTNRMSLKIPTDVDIRAMLTFLELYQTLLGFVFFKLYFDAELVYPPFLDISKDNDASGVGAFRLNTTTADLVEGQPTARHLDSKHIEGREIRRTIKEISDGPTDPPNPSPAETLKAQYYAMSIPNSSPHLFTSPSSSMFSPYTFFLAPGSPRHLLEFMICSFGGRVGWPPSMGSGSPLREEDESITHVIIDRPLSSPQLQRGNCKFVQPQWVADSINAQRALPEGPYAQGATLPPHLSPFGEVYPHIDSGRDHVFSGTPLESSTAQLPSVQVLHLGDNLALRSAELAAERAGLSAQEFGTCSANDERSRTSNAVDLFDKEMNKMMMSNRQRKLYERIRHSERKRIMEVRMFVSAFSP